MYLLHRIIPGVSHRVSDCRTLELSEPWGCWVGKAILIGRFFFSQRTVTRVFAIHRPYEGPDADGRARACPCGRRDEKRPQRRSTAYRRAHSTQYSVCVRQLQLRLCTDALLPSPRSRRHRSSVLLSSCCHTTRPARLRVSFASSMSVLAVPRHVPRPSPNSQLPTSNPNSQLTTHNFQSPFAHSPLHPLVIQKKCTRHSTHGDRRL